MIYWFLDRLSRWLHNHIANSPRERIGLPLDGADALDRFKSEFERLVFTCFVSSFECCFIRNQPNSFSSVAWLHVLRHQKKVKIHLIKSPLPRILGQILKPLHYFIGLLFTQRGRYWHKWTGDSTTRITFINKLTGGQEGKQYIFH